MRTSFSILGLLLFLVASCPAFDTHVADQVAEGHVSEIGIPWHFPSNRIDWLFNPTKAKPPYNPEWTWQLNRLRGWRELAEAYLATKNEKYARAFAVQLADWLDQTGGVPPEKGYNVRESPWRTIEEGIRLMGPCPFAYRAFEHAPSLTESLKARFLACMRAQARHLMAHPSPGGNWLLMEMDGVYTFACKFPELPESAALRKKSAAILAAAIREQVLPDGLHYELSPDYHLVFYVCAAQMFDTAREHGFVHELPDDFASILERGADGFVNTMTPGFVQPRFNDCYTIGTKDVLEKAVRLFPNRKDFLWAATKGREGTPPAGETPSRFLPYAGFAVMRSGWDCEAACLAFDVGPLGMGHWHQDKLSFTLWKGDEELVFDDGGGQYETSDFRKYALSGYDHNTLLVDGLAQNRRGPKLAELPIDAAWSSTPARDFARGTYDQGFGPKELKLARHTREITFEKPELFRVTDTVASADGREHDYELLFHVDTTNVAVASDRRSLVAHFGRKWDLALALEASGTLSLQSGVEKPRLAGWFVGRNNLTVHRATTISVKAPRARDVRFVTTLRPVKAHRPTDGLDFTGIFPENVKCVHIVAPSSHAGNDVVQKATNELAKAGYKVKVAPSVWKYSSDPKIRARDIEAAWRDPETDLILCARGGKGAWDTLRELDFDLLKSREIPFVGFSNISVLNNAFVAKGVKRAVTGPMCTSLVNYPTSADSIARLRATLAREPLEPTHLKVLRAPSNAVTGRPVGGHWPSISRMEGDWLPDTTGRIVFLEVNKTYKFDRAKGTFDLLKGKGYFKSPAAIVLCDLGITGTKEEKAKLRDYIVQAVTCPVFDGYPYGHVKKLYAIDFDRELTVSPSGLLSWKADRSE